MIENGFVRLPKKAAWLAEYLHELTVFPKGKHDDQVPPDTSFRGQPRTCSTGSSCRRAGGSISYMKSGIKPNRPPIRRRRSCRRYRCCSASPSVVTKPLEHDRMTEAYRGLVDERASCRHPRRARPSSRRKKYNWYGAPIYLDPRSGTCFRLRKICHNGCYEALTLPADRRRNTRCRSSGRSPVDGWQPVAASPTQQRIDCERGKDCHCGEQKIIEPAHAT